jgi:hypothetical protein
VIGSIIGTGVFTMRGLLAGAGTNSIPTPSTVRTDPGALIGPGISRSVRK